MARRAHVYPQVEVGAAAIVDARLVTAPAGLSVAPALRLVRQRDAHGLVADGRIVLREDLARAASLGIDGARATALARPVPTVNADATEASVRRHLAAGAPLVAVRDDHRIIGGVSAPSAVRPCMSMTDRLARRLPAAARDALAAVARVAAERGARAYLAGGVVRDALADLPLDSPDLDIVVEGDGPGVARALADALSAPLLAHERFLTATVEPTPAGRIDVATARSERYDTRGALPRVLPASIEADLRRRDFTINAMAVELHSGSFGLLDPHGGRYDVAARRLRVLHPASYVEDPTRIFRAARYAVRLGLHADPWTTRVQAWAVSLAPYPALSGARLVNELEHALAEADAESVLVRLATGGAFRLLDPRLRATRTARARLARFAAARAWARTRHVVVADIELLLFALLDAQAPAIARDVLQRLGIAGEPSTRLLRALARYEALARDLGAASRPSQQAHLLRPVSTLELAWLAAGDDREVTARSEDATRRTGDARPALRGHDVIAFGVPAGPAVAAALEALNDARLDGEVTTRSEEEAFVRAWARTVDGRGPSGPGSSRKER
jgi:tRNA nucleotidyltransferase (CCA-adding enzyme)